MQIKPFPSRSPAVSFLKAVLIRAKNISIIINFQFSIFNLQSLWLLIYANLC